MIRNYFVTAMRNIARHKVFSLFNIAGLAVGLAIFILAAGGPRRSAYVRRSEPRTTPSSGCSSRSC